MVGCLVMFGSASAKPMLAPTLEEALRSPSIVVAEYVGVLPEQQITYFSGARVEYKLLEVLKGPSLASTFSVRYQFTDGSACLEPKNWSFEKELMPARGNRWILFLQGEEESGARTTYRGSFGRREASPLQVSEIKRMLLSHQ